MGKLYLYLYGVELYAWVMIETAVSGLLQCRPPGRPGGLHHRGRRRRRWCGAFAVGLQPPPTSMMSRIMSVIEYLERGAAAVGRRDACD